MGAGLLERLSGWLAAAPWTGAAVGAAGTGGLAWLAVCLDLFGPAYGIASFALGAAAGLVPAAAAVAGVVRVGRRLHPGAARLAGAAAGCGVLLATLGRALGEPGPEAFVGLVAVGAVGGAAASLLARRSGWAVAALVLALPLGAAVAFDHVSNRPRGEDPEPLAPGHGPGRPGPHETWRFRYGSGEDARRPEFGAAVDRVTGSVDAADLLPAWSGLRGWLRTRWWGFGPEQLPVNGRAWLPDGPGPFPLVLVVHGNHPMERFSDAGYAYLAEHLASRGLAVASVDQNFLNRSFFADLLRGGSGDLEARAALLLEHLGHWRRWSETPGDPLHGRVDLGQVALIGHSRGGEAVVLAAVRNREPLRGDGGEARFAHGFGIRGVAALAPVVGLARSDGTPLALEDASYLVLHGSHDGDLRSFEGARQFDAVRLTGTEGVKAAVWIEGANHGQFNRDWGATDVGAPLAPLVARRRMLRAGQQERVTQVFLDAFLGAVLQGERDFLEVLRDPGSAAEVLPRARLRARYQGAGFRVLSDFEEDDDPKTASLQGGRHSGTRLLVWREDGVEGRWHGERSASRAVHLGWERSGPGVVPHYALHLPDGAAPPGDGGILAFSLADADYARIGRDGPIELGLELEDASGQRARLPLRRFGTLRPLYDRPMLRPEIFDPRPEIVFRSFEAPLAAFAEANPRFDPARLRSIRFVFDGTESGLLVLDDIGWRATPRVSRPERELERSSSLRHRRGARACPRPTSSTTGPTSPAEASSSGSSWRRPRRPTVMSAGCRRSRAEASRPWWRSGRGSARGTPALRLRS